MSESIQRDVEVQVDRITLPGTLAIPPGATGAVLFAHGSGSSRFSPRNRFVAGTLQQAGLATLLIDLLTEEEDEIDQITAELRFDIRLLAERLVAAIDWLQATPVTADLPIGLFGSSTGAAAALVAAAARPRQVGTVVSRGGRPDLAGDALSLVVAPTLLLVGGHDEVVIELNREAMRRLEGEKELRIIPGATHLFSEPGALEEVARFAAGFFARRLGAGLAAPAPAR